MKDCAYVKSILSKYDDNGAMPAKEREVLADFSHVLHDWFETSYHPTGDRLHLTIIPCGSRINGTAIKGRSDMDLLLSIYDPDGANALVRYYEDLYRYLQSKGYVVRKRNAAIGVQYKDCDIDLVPGKQLNSSLESKRDYHYLWLNKQHKKIQRNVRELNELVSRSGVLDEIMLVKIWRDNHRLDFPSIYMELLCIDTLQKHDRGNLADNFLYLLRFIADNVERRRVVDPTNRSNVLSRTLSASEKTRIAQTAKASLAEQDWTKILW